MDPHGADQRGNPLGGLVFSNAFGANSSRNGTTSSGAAYSQVVQWHKYVALPTVTLPERFRRPGVEAKAPSPSPFATEPALTQFFPWLLYSPLASWEPTSSVSRPATPTTSSVTRCASTSTTVSAAT